MNIFIFLPDQGFLSKDSWFLIKKYLMSNPEIGTSGETLRGLSFSLPKLLLYLGKGLQLASVTFLLQKSLRLFNLLLYWRPVTTGKSIGKVQGRMFCSFSVKSHMTSINGPVS